MYSRIGFIAPQHDAALIAQANTEPYGTWMLLPFPMTQGTEMLESYLGLRTAGIGVLRR